MNKDDLKRWRLILGHSSQDDLSEMGACRLSDDQMAMGEALAAIYDDTDCGESAPRSAGFGISSPALAKWLGDIRNYSQEDVVSVIQQDAIERKGLTQLLFEPEMLKSVEANPQLAGTLMSLNGQIPERAKETARMVVQAVVDKIKRLLEQKIRQAVMGALNRNEHSPIPSVSSIDWKWTIDRNLKNYQPDLGTIIPGKVWFYSRAQRSNNWAIIVDMDQIGSMAESVVYGSVTGSSFASLPALKTHVVAFDTEAVDLTEIRGNDPVDMIFGSQLGGGTDINKSVAYCEQFITDPSQTLFFLITDLCEGGNEAQLVRHVRDMVESGVQVICLLALSDGGVPFYNEGLAKKLSRLEVPCFGCSPSILP